MLGKGDVFRNWGEELGGEQEGRLPRIDPIEGGVDADGIARFVEAVNAKVDGLHKMMLLKGGKVVAEAAWAPYDFEQTHMLYSLSKSFTSTAIGVAVTEGKLTVEDKVLSFFPDKSPANPSDHLKAMRVKDLLTMNTGHATEPGRSSGDWVKDFLAAPVVHAPGSHFLYNTMATHVLAAIVYKLTGQNLTEYLTTRLFEPLGIAVPHWDKSPAGIDFGGSGLYLRIEDIAKFGQLYLQMGQWQGKTILPQSWIEEATSKQVTNGDPSEPNDWTQGYGYQFWRCRHGFYRGDGAFGQYCIVMQDKDAVLAINSGVSDMGAVMEAAWTHLIPALGTGRGDAAALSALLRRQEVPRPLGAPTSTKAGEVGGKSYAMDANEEGIRTLRFSFEGQGGELEIKRADASARLPFGFDAWRKGSWFDGSQERDAATMAAWKTENELVLKVCLLDGPHIWSETYRFENDRIMVADRRFNFLFGPTERPSLNGRRSA
jgi:CubicO group peptidase (beta-lactamase class C family)